jgi:N-acetylneuraminic acid mutarotase
MAYDTQSDRVILFFGENWAPPNIEPKGETWAYDTNTDTWTNMKPDDSPYGILGSQMVYDSESDRMILFSGWDVETLSDKPDTWAYDYDTNTWTKLEPNGLPPFGENYFAMSYDAGADRVIAWKRHFNPETNAPEYKVGVYDYNTNTWEVRETENHPAGYVYNAMAYDPGTGLNILFGGVDRGEVPTNETWAYDYANNRWLKVFTKNPPGARGWHAMVYDTAAGKIILVGGGTSRDDFTAETRMFDPATNEWTNLDQKP